MKNNLEQSHNISAAIYGMLKCDREIDFRIESAQLEDIVYATQIFGGEIKMEHLKIGDAYSKYLMSYRLAHGPVTVCLIREINPSAFFLQYAAFGSKTYKSYPEGTELTIIDNEYFVSRYEE